MSSLMLVRIAGAAFVAGVCTLAACGGPSGTECRSETWQGQCTLRSITKIREAEFPAPHVVLEVIYAPQTNSQYPSFTPPEVREQMQVLANQELPLRDHFAAHAQAQCHVKPAPPGKCIPGDVIVQVPPFNPDTTVASTPTGPTGCAQIESQATQDRVRGDIQTGSTMSEVFQFEQSSSELSPAAQPMVAAIAQRLKQTPALECVAVVGYVSPGEQMGIADSRARAVKSALVAQGVDASRLVIIAVTQNVFGSGTGAPPPDPKMRKVMLRVLLDRGAAP